MYLSFSKGEKVNSAGIRRPYLRILGIQIDSGGPGRASGSTALTPEEEEELRQLSTRPDIYDIIAKSIAPSIYGSIGEPLIYQFTIKPQHVYYKIPLNSFN